VSDIVERLLRDVDPDDPNLWDVDRVRLDAAAEVKRLRAALNRIRWCPDWHTATKIACEALRP
jgi:hypothetical protein